MRSSVVQIFPAGAYRHYRGTATLAHPAVFLWHVSCGSRAQVLNSQFTSSRVLSRTAAKDTYARYNIIPKETSAVKARLGFTGNKNFGSHIEVSAEGHPFLTRNPAWASFPVSYGGVTCTPLYYY